MKVIEKGNYKEDWSIQLKCTGKEWKQDSKPCHAKLEIEDGDIFFRDYQGYGDTSSERYYGFVCSECGCFTEVESEKIPESVKEFARSYENYKRMI